MSQGKQHEQYLLAGLVFAVVFSAALLVDVDAQPSPVSSVRPVHTPPTNVAEPRATHARKNAIRTKPAPVSPPANCKEARQRGIAPIYRGDPNYSARMDGDDDGIACEPYHRKGY